MNDPLAKAPLPARRWIRAVLAVAIAGNLIGAGGAMYVLDAGTNELSVDEAVQQYRAANAPASAGPTTVASPTATAGATAVPSARGAPAQPPKKAKPKAPAASSLEETAPGVYVYATDGYEETDALSGQRHDYPKQTTITVSRHTCGVRMRWQPLKERWEETDGCPRAEGFVLDRFAVYHEFFQRSETEEFALEDALVMPAQPVAGDTWTWKGQSQDTTIDTLTTVIGFETITVGSEKVRTLHVRYETTLAGDNEGHQTQDRWMTAESGLLVRLISSMNAKVEVPFGGKANYEERYRLDLTSLDPAS